MIMNENRLDNITDCIDYCDVIVLWDWDGLFYRRIALNWGRCLKYWSCKIFLARNLARCLVSQHCERLERFLVSRLCEMGCLASRKITVETLRD